MRRPPSLALVAAAAWVWFASAALAQPPATEPPKAEAPAAEPAKPALPQPEAPGEPGKNLESAKTDAPKSDAARAPAGKRLFDQSPYDQITLTAEQGGAVLKVMPLDLPMRKLPDSPRGTDKLIVRLVEEPEQDYELQWYHVAEVKLFEQLILDEANRLASAGQFDEAYIYFEHLRREYPSLPGLNESVGAFLYEEAKSLQRDGRYDGALNLLSSLFDHDPKFAGLENAFGLATGKLVEQYTAGGEYASAHSLLRNLKDHFPNSPAAAAWESSLSQQAAELLARAKSDLAAGRMSAAQDAGRAALSIWPPLSDARQFLASAFQKHPRVIVGVTTPAPAKPSNELIDWAARRTGRLVRRRLLEFTGYGPEGGVYTCPLGAVETAELGRRIEFQLQPPRDVSAADAPTGYDVARGLFALAQPGEPGYSAHWADLFAAVQVRDVFGVDIDLKRSHVRPVAVLSAALATEPDDAADSTALVLPGSYAPGDSPQGPARYVAGPAAGGAAVPTREIVERRYATEREAVQALLTGDVPLVDRVAPWDVKTLQAHKELTVERYSVYTVHCLLPNMNRPFPAHRAFRRGIEYGIHRGAILKNQLLRGSEQEGCIQVSGPFAKGTSVNDPAGYAYNDELAPREYEPRLAKTLLAVALHDVQVAAKERGQEVAEIPPLVLAHPPHDVARVACRAIAKHLKAIGLTINLREIEPGAAAALAPDDDLLYAELTLAEPLVDARRLLAADGLVGAASPYMSQALRQVDAATGWREAAAALKQVHRIAQEDAAVIPLWQLAEHLAYHQSLRGVGTQPATLYQNVEKWQGGLRLPAEAQSP